MTTYWPKSSCLFVLLMQAIEPMVARTSHVIAQRATLVQPLVRPVLRRYVQRRTNAPHFWHSTATITRIPPEATRLGRSVSREQGRTASMSVFCLLHRVGVPRERTRQNEPSRHSITPDTLHANGTTRTLVRVQRLCTLSISRVSTKATSDPYPSPSHVYHIGTCARTSQAPQPGG